MKIQKILHPTDFSDSAKAAFGHALFLAQQFGADMVVLATHGLTGLQRMLLGSVAEQVVRLSPVPVWTVKSFGKSLLD